MSRSNNDRDDFLWEKAAAGDPEAEEQIITKYTQLVRICARPYFLAGADGEDLLQEGMMGLLSAVRHYDTGKDVQFRTYAELCIRRRLITAIRSASRNKHNPLNDSMSFESPHFDETLTRASYLLRDPEELVIARECVCEITEDLYRSLSKFEAKVLGLYLEGLSYEEIAEKVNKSPKSVDNAVQRIRKKAGTVL